MSLPAVDLRRAIAGEQRIIAVTTNQHTIDDCRALINDALDAMNTFARGDDVTKAEKDRALLTLFLARNAHPEPKE